MIVEAIRGDRTFEEIPGVAYINGDGRLVANHHKLWPQENLHLPARITTKRIHDEVKGMVWAEDSRGCDSNCTFCSRRGLRGSGFSGDMSPKRVADDLEQLNNMDIYKVSFTGDDFGGDPERTFRIADEIIQRGIRMEWSVSTRADHVFERKNTPEQNARLKEIMKHCAEAGLTRVFLGLESGSQSQLKRYGKQITVEENYKAIEVLREIDVDVVAGYMPIDYLMTVTELRETLEFLEKTGMGLKVSNPLSVLRVQAGSPYLKLMKNEGLLGEKTEDLVFYKAHFKDPRIELVAQLADKWVEDLYPLIFGLKGEVATVTLAKENQNSPARNVETTLHAFRRLELEFLKVLVGNLEVSESIDRDSVNTIRETFVEKRRQLLEGVKSQLLMGAYGDIQTSRLLNCLKEVSQYC
ncbi:MAG: radical SAM protein [Candidatus Levybacteria bacterium]|nr:radical SAM protein [Candidatus Levybacteria bacterium]